MRHYNKCHDEFLKNVNQDKKEHIPSTASSSVDLQDKYSFPQHIAQTDFQPDIIVWDDECKSVTMIELTIPFDTIMQEAADRKKEKYRSLVTSNKKKGYSVTVITIEVVSRGLPHEQGFNKLRQHLGLGKKTTRGLMISMSKQAIQGSHTIWKSRNTNT